MVERQQTLFGPSIGEVLGRLEDRDRAAKARMATPPIDPHVEAEEVPRLSGQNAAILALFRAAPRRRVTNLKLAQIALKYTSRVSDLRAAGYHIELVQRLEGGVTVYELQGGS